MNPLLKYECFCNEFGFDIRFLRYEYQELEAVEMYLKLHNDFTPYNFVKMCGKLGLIYVADISDLAVEMIIQ